jgi:SAM-dependent methyltransferase
MISGLGVAMAQPYVGRETKVLLTHAGSGEVGALATDLSPHYLDLAFMSPLSDRRADRLVQFLADSEPRTVLDLGCGWAELLLRTLSVLPDALGIGIDSDADAIEHGRALAASRGLADRVTLSAGDASAAAPKTADAVICIGASQIWDPNFAARGPTEPLDYRRALTAIRGLVARGGRVVYGEVIWSTAPNAAAAAPLLGRLDEFVPLADVVETAVDCGFASMAFHEADVDEWDIFESGYSACYARWLAGHDPQDPDADDIRQRARRQRVGYLNGYRGVLGMAYLELLAL